MESQVVAEVEQYEAAPIDVADAVFADPNAAVELEEDTGSLEPISGKSIVAGDVEDSEEARECLQRIKERNKALEEFEENHYWTLAEDLYRVRSKELYKLVGYAKYPEYLDKELGMARRRGYYLANTYEYLEISLRSILADKPDLYSTFVEAVKKMGWTKASQIAGAKSITSDNALEIIPEIIGEKQDGGFLTVREIQSLCKSEKKKLEDGELEEADGGDEALGKSTKTLRFTFTLAQYNDVVKAMTQMESLAKPGTEKGTLLTSICKDYLSTYVAGTTGKIDIPVILSNYERLSGLNIVAYDAQTSEVVYGKDHLPDEES